MKGYCVDVRGFSAEKKQLVAETIDGLCGYTGFSVGLEDFERDRNLNYITNVNRIGKTIDFSLLLDDVNPEQLQYEITFEKLRTLHLGWDMLEGTEQPDKNETKDLSASRAIAMFYSKEEENKELKNKVCELEADIDWLEDIVLDLKDKYEKITDSVRSAECLEIDRIYELEKELADHKKLSFTMTLVAIVCFPLAVLLF